MHTFMLVDKDKAADFDCTLCYQHAPSLHNHTNGVLYAVCQMGTILTIGACH